MQDEGNDFLLVMRSSLVVNGKEAPASAQFGPSAVEAVSKGHQKTGKLP